MNKITTIYKLALENSINPFLIFDSNGKLIEYNNEAEFTLSFIKKEELFQIALENATHFPGFKQTYLDLDLGQISFCAVSVGYIDDDHICLTLHKNICKKSLKLTDKLQSANIFTIFDVAINANMVDPKKLKVEYDISIPEFKFNIDAFLKLLNKIFKKIRDAKTIYIKVVLATGRYLKIEKKNYPVVSIDIKPEGIDIKKLQMMEDEFLITRSKEGIHIELPLIL